MALSDHDRKLLERCLAREPRAWEDFVDRYLGLVVHVIQHTLGLRNQLVTHQDREDLVGEVFLAIVDQDFRLLRRFRGRSSLATYLTVVARRIVARGLDQRLQRRMAPLPAEGTPAAGGELERITNREIVEALISELNPREADIVRMYHLEGKSYQEISRVAGLPENSIGPTLSRARAKLRTTQGNV